MEKDLSRRGVLRLGAGVALGGIATAFVPTIANAVETRTARAMTPPQNATWTFGTIRYGDRADRHTGINRSASPQVRTVKNVLKKGGEWTTRFHVYTITWAALPTTEVLIPTSLRTQDAAKALAFEYAKTLGLLPRGLRGLVHTIVLNPGLHNMTGKEGVITYYDESKYDPARMPDGFTHEATHTLYNNISDKPALLARWNDAAKADRRAGGGFISRYAAEHPDREDMSESMVAWLSVRCHADRLNAIDPRYVPFIRSQIANRIEFFRSLGLDLAPLGG